MGTPADSRSVGFEWEALHARWVEVWTLIAMHGSALIVPLMGILALMGPFSAAVFIKRDPPERNSGAQTISSEAATAWGALRRIRPPEAPAAQPTFVTDSDRPPTVLEQPKTRIDNPPEIASGEPRNDKTSPSLASIENEVGATTGAPSPSITLVLKADLSAQRLTVLEGDTVVHVWPISSGVDGYPTPVGIFQPKSANKMWYSRQYDWTPMPYAVFFTRGVAFHGTDATSRLGKPASHGCIRLATSDAAQLFDLVHKHGFEQTSILVHGTPSPLPVALQRAEVKSPPRKKTPLQQSNGFPSWAAAVFNFRW
jgi:lipoprotein-anchoring transpeptidase ErfK/SrfK